MGKTRDHFKEIGDNLGNIYNLRYADNTTLMA